MPTSFDSVQLPYTAQSKVFTCMWPLHVGHKVEPFCCPRCTHGGRAPARHVMRTFCGVAFADAHVRPHTTQVTTPFRHSSLHIMAR